MESRPLKSFNPHLYPKRVVVKGNRFEFFGFFLSETVDTLVAMGCDGGQYTEYVFDKRDVSCEVLA